MPDLALAKSVRRRTRGSEREVAMLNMFLEADEQAPDGLSRHSRQGISVSQTIEEGPVHGLFSRRGVLNGDLFAVSGSSLYRSGTMLGGISGVGPVSFAASAFELVLTRGATAYSYDGTDLAAISFPDGAAVTAVAYLGGYFFFAKAGTHRIYWSTSLDARTIDGLDFVSAESEPDSLLDLYVVNDSLWAMGQASVEIFQLTGDADAVIARVEGLLLKKGIIATGAAAELDNTLFWWGHDHRIYRASQGAPQSISDPSLEEQLATSALRDVFAYTFEGHDNLVVRTDTGTFVHDVAYRNWWEAGTHGRTNWRVQNAAVTEDGLVFGDDEDGRIWAFEAENWDDGETLERRISAGFNGTGGAIAVHNLCVVGNPGDTPLLAGQGAEPALEMRSSRDNGKRWGDWRQASLGQQGKYRQRIEKRRWGIYDRQGGVFELRCTDPVPLRISRVYANEPSGGRENK